VGLQAYRLPQDLQEASSISAEKPQMEELRESGDPPPTHGEELRCLQKTLRRHLLEEWGVEQALLRLVGLQLSPFVLGMKVMDMLNLLSEHRYSEDKIDEIFIEAIAKELNVE
jgi:hypothetical protein